MGSALRAISLVQGGKQLRTRLSFLLCGLAPLLPSLGAAEDASFSMAGFDGDSSNHDWTANEFFVRMEERTGVSFTFAQYTDYDKWQAAKAAMLADGGELPDVLFKAALTTEDQLAFAQSGKLIDLKPLLEEHAPHLWALLQSNPEWLAAVTLPDGKIVALPELTDVPPQNAMWINKKWLETLKLETPTDAASLRAVLEAFLTGDPNQNGKADEIPLSFLGTWDLKFLSHAFGFVMNDYNLYVDESGKVVYAPATDAFAEMLGYLRGLYADGLLDAQGFYTADSLRAVTDTDAAVTYGLFFGPNPMNLLPYKQSEEYAVLLPLTYDGKQTYRDLGGEATTGAFAITSACEDPAKLLEWVDVLYTEEGAIEAMAGKEGVNYALDEDGRWEYVSEDATISSETLYSLSVYDSGSMPWRFPTTFYNQYAADSIRRISDEVQALRALSAQPFPDSFRFASAEQSAKARQLQSELGVYVDESMGRFILGQQELTEETLAAFRQGLAERGMDEMVAFWQEIYDSLNR